MGKLKLSPIAGGTVKYCNLFGKLPGIFKKDLIYLFSERREGREKGRERSFDPLPLTRPQPGTWPSTQACALRGDGTGDLLVHRLVLSPLSHTSQGTTWQLLKNLNIRLTIQPSHSTPKCLLERNESMSTKDLALARCSVGQCVPRHTEVVGPAPIRAHTRVHHR